MSPIENNGAHAVSKDVTTDKLESDRVVTKRTDSVRDDRDDLDRTTRSVAAVSTPFGKENDGSARDWTNKPWLRDLGLFLLRLYGLTLFLHGYHKVQIFSQFRDGLAHYPISSVNPTIFAVLVILGQLFLGIFLALGLFTRLAAFFISFMMFVIWMIVHVMAAKGGGLISAQTGGLNGESAILWVALTLPLIFTGAGRWSVDQLIAKARGKRRAAEVAD